MAKAKKLPSGQWRTLAYSHTDAAGKRHYESFTAPTKKESELMAAQFAAAKKGQTLTSERTLGAAIDDYISSRSNVLSPSTIREYDRMKGMNFESIRDMKISQIDSAVLQHWVNAFAADHSPKTVKNSYGFLNAVLAAALPDKVFRVRLPQSIRYDAEVPTDEQVAALIAYHKSNDIDMYIASCLAAFGSLRRSEICPLTTEDIKDNCILIRKAMVQDKNDRWVIKEANKNSTSHRIVPMPDNFIEELQIYRSDSDLLVGIHPGKITRRHANAVKRLGIPSFRFHDLRHYTASVMHAIGIPDQYIMQRGGWSSDRTLKSIYRGTISTYSDIYTEQALQHFDNITH